MFPIEYEFIIANRESELQARPVLMRRLAVEARLADRKAARINREGRIVRARRALRAAREGYAAGPNLEAAQG